MRIVSVKRWSKAIFTCSASLTHKWEYLNGGWEKWRYMEMRDPRGWVFYYLICFVALLWVGFLTAQGVMIFVSLFLTLIVLGFSAILCVMLVLELKNSKETQNTR